MTEEEQFAINTLEYVNRWKTSEDKYTLETLNAIDTLLNLIEKQQKEIKELKEKEKNLLKQLKDSEKELLEVTQNVVSKDKIREKIKELYETKQYWNTEVVDILKELLEEE